LIPDQYPFFAIGVSNPFFGLACTNDSTVTRRPLNGTFKPLARSILHGGNLNPNLQKKCLSLAMPWGSKSGLWFLLKSGNKNNRAKTAQVD